MADGPEQPQQHQHQQLPPTQQKPLVCCHAATEMGSVAPDSQDCDVQRGPVKSNTRGGEVKFHLQQQLQQ